MKDPILLCLLIFLSISQLSAQPGNLDNTFGVLGQLTQNIDAESDLVSRVALQLDGKIVVTGTAYSASNFPFIYRYNANGSLDNIFSPNLSSIGFAEVHAIVVQSDGKIVLGGEAFGGDFAIARFTTAGALEFFESVTFSSSAQVKDLAMQSDGKIVAVGWDAAGDSYAVCRLNSNGTLDNTFGTAGTVNFTVGLFGYPHAVAIQSDGKIVLVGETDNGSDKDIAVVRLNSNGSFDNTFGTGGINAYAYDIDDIGEDVALDRDNNIYVTGSFDDSSGDADIFVMKLLSSNGALAAGSFGPTGSTTFDFSSFDDEGLAILVEPSGNVLVGGTNGIDFQLVKLLPDGSLDGAFSGDGFQNIDFVGDGICQSLALQPDGKIIACGVSDLLDMPDFSLVRLQNDPFVTVVNTNDAGFGSLRQAIINANNVTGTQLIDFNIPGNGPHTINLLNNGLVFTETAIVDATTQPGWSSTNLITLNGSTIPAITRNGLVFYAPDCEVYGFQFSGFSGSTASWGIEVGDDNITIGAPNKGNVFNNCYAGISIIGMDNCTIQGNKIGTNVSGTTAQGNAFGILIQAGGSGHLIGGTAAGTGNLISGNTGGVNEGYGIYLSGGITNTSIQGNSIGLNLAGTAGIPNLRDGILIDGGANLNTIGGTTAGMANQIAYNGNNGINIQGSVSINNSIRRNSIFCNTAGGISFSTGGNNLKAAPIITSANLTAVAGTCSSCANGETIEVFIDEDPCVAPRQAKTYLGTTTVTSGAWSLAAANYQTTLALGNRVTATATTATGETSLISPAFIAASAAPILGTPAPGAVTYTENAPATAISATGLTITDADSPNLTQATIQFASGYQNGQDVLALVLPQAGITTATFVAATGVLTLTGNGTLAQWTNALRAVTYVNTSDNPNTATRVVSFQVSDGSNLSNTVTRNITITSVNDAPILASTSVSGTLNYTEGSGAVVLNSEGFTIGDADNTTIASATIAITGNYQSAEDRLILAPLPTGITNASFVISTGVLTLTGTGTLTQWQTALASITYENLSNNPNTTNRTVSFRVNDGVATNNLSNIITHTIIINPVNNLPTGANTSFNTDEDMNYTFQSSDFAFNDIDGTFDGIQIVSLPSAGVIEFNNVSVVIGQIYSPVNQLVFKPNPNDNGLNYTTFLFKVVDNQGGASAADYTVTANVLPVNDAPTIDPITSPQQPINLNASDVVLNLTGISSGASNENQTILINVKSSHPTIIPMTVNALNYTSPNTTGTLTYKPIIAVSAPTDVTITLRVKDSGLTLNGGVDSTVISFIVPVVPVIPPPRTLTAFTISETEIALKWDNLNGNQGYEIQRSVDNIGNFQTIATVNKDVVDFNNTGLSPRTQYFYRVRLLSAAGNSDWSNIAGAFTADISTAPSNLQGTSTNPNLVELTWQDNSNNEFGFILYRASVFTDFEFEEIAVLAPNTVSYSDRTVFGNVLYRYEIRSFNENGLSAANQTEVTSAINPNLPDPPRPINLDAEALSPIQIDLNWEFNLNPRIRFQIERRDATLGGPFELIDIIINDSLTQFKGYSDVSRLSADTKYCYRIRAIGESGFSAYSDSACAFTACRLKDIVVIRDDPGGQIICNGKAASLTISQDVFRASYQWRRNGVPIEGANFKSFLAGQTGFYDCEIAVGNNCQDVTLNQVLVIVQGNPTPVTIEYDGEFLRASIRDADSYQWYQDFAPVSGATQSTYATTSPGVYFVVITIAGCASTSQQFTLGEVTALEKNDISHLLRVYPSPTTGRITVKLESSMVGKYQMSLIDLQGKTYELKQADKDGKELEESIDLTQFANGLYFLEVKAARYFARKKVVKF
ncbi:MAG: T9SS type A sorting domain-containing protein [Microscillaceae bacterium]|jgi:uncharacterized delta-60 repeat protein|nr:T9SS type A sorting domain-containing protein [Microscillaceae bacterium]